MRNFVLFVVLPILLIGNEILSLIALSVLGAIAAFAIMKKY